MIELRTLGALDLRTADGRELRSILAQPKRVALLAYLSAVAPDYQRRDSLLGLFWPDSDEQHARAALNRAVHFLRSFLGEGVLLSRGDELGLARDALGSDVASFRSALKKGHHDAALELYRGDFLEGFFLSDTPEFEHWVERMRGELRNQAADSARALSRNEQANGNLALALHWAKRASSLAPYDEADLRAVMTLLDRTGDRSSAVDCYERFAVRLRDQLEVEPSAETRALLTAIATADRGDSVVVNKAPPAAVASGPEALRPRRRVSRAAAVAVLLVVTAAAFIAFNRSLQRAAHTTAPELPETSLRAFGDGVTDPETYDLYVWGLYYWNGRTKKSLPTAIAYFERAAARDSLYAPAFTGLAICYDLLAAYEERPSEVMPKAKAAALRALALDERQSEAHAALAYVATWYEWDWTAAEVQFQRALALNPGSATAHHWYSLYLATRGRMTESIAEIRRASELDPSSLFLREVLGARLVYAREYARAAEQLEKVRDLNPDVVPAQYLGYAYLMLGRTQDAIAYLEQVRTNPVHRATRGALTDGALAMAYAAAGRQASARELLHQLETRARHEYVPPSVIARIYAALNDREQALTWLEQAYDQRDGWLTFIKVDPTLDGLRAEPRFQRLLTRLGLR